MNDGVVWLAAVNLITWTGLFLYLLRLDRQIRRAEGERSEATPPGSRS